MKDPRSKPFRFDQSWDLPLSATALWERVSDPRRLCDWWDWLERFDGGEFTDGAKLQMVVRSPLWYSLQLTLRVDEVVPAERLVTTVQGDLDGPAVLTIEATGSAQSRARISWELVLARQDLRIASLLVRPAMVWAHDRVVAQSMDDFRSKVLGP